MCCPSPRQIRNQTFAHKSLLVSYASEILYLKFHLSRSVAKQEFFENRSGNTSFLEWIHPHPPQVAGLLQPATQHHFGDLGTGGRAVWMQERLGKIWDLNLHSANQKRYQLLDRSLDKGDLVQVLRKLKKFGANKGYNYNTGFFVLGYTNLANNKDTVCICLFPELWTSNL